jgi:hypothetical protein
MESGVGTFHFGRNLACGPDLNQRPLADSRTRFSFAFPTLAILHQFWPKRVEAALNWLDGVNAAALRAEEVALAHLGLPETQLVFKTNHVPTFKLGWLQAHEMCGSNQIFFR